MCSHEIMVFNVSRLQHSRTVWSTWSTEQKTKAATTRNWVSHHRGDSEMELFQRCWSQRNWTIPTFLLLVFKILKKQEERQMQAKVEKINGGDTFVQFVPFSPTDPFSGIHLMISESFQIFKRDWTNQRRNCKRVNFDSGMQMQTISPRVWKVLTSPMFQAVLFVPFKHKVTLLLCPHLC